MYAKTITAGPMPVWSGGSDSTPIFIPMTGFGSTAGVHQVRPSMEMRASSGACEIKFGYQLANDTESPETAVAVGSFLSSEGFSYGSSFTDISSATELKLYIRWGVWVQDTSGTKIEMCRASIRVDIES